MKSGDADFTASPLIFCLFKLRYSLLSAAYLFLSIPRSLNIDFSLKCLRIKRSIFPRKNCISIAITMLEERTAANTTGCSNAGVKLKVSSSAKIEVGITTVSRAPTAEITAIRQSVYGIQRNTRFRNPTAVTAHSAIELRQSSDTVL